MARPSKLNEELINNFAAEIEDGLPITYVCDLFGVTSVSYFNWMKIGEADFNNEEETLYAQFFNTIKKSYAKFIKASHKGIREGDKGWQGVCWWLERTNANFMPKQEIQAGDDGKVQVIIGGKQPKVNDTNKR